MKKLFLLFLIFWTNVYVLHAQTEQGTGTKTNENQLKEKELPKDSLMERRFLSLEKNGAVKRIRFYENQVIKFSLKNDNQVYNTVIQKINKEDVMLMDVAVPLKDFDRITVEYNRYYPRLFEYAFFVGGAGYFALDMINNEFNFNSKSWQVPVSLLTSSLIIKLIYPKRRNFKLSNQKYLKTIGF